jgi:hypothetical protein
MTIKSLYKSIEQTDKNLLYLFFLIGWLLLNLVQAGFSQLHYDEAYYWIYSKHLAWGYFDHPPMVAILVKAGYEIFQNEVGVRLFFVLMGTLTLAMVCYLINEREKIFFLFLFLFSIPLFHLHVCGFLAIPDTPLVFFATLFFVLYREFLKKDTYVLAIALGLIAAAMLYSKYHGILVIVFTMLSNLKLLKNKKTWLAAFIIILAMVPHLWWQYINQFPTLNFQLMGRLRHVGFFEPFTFMLGQLVLPGFFSGAILVFLTIVYKPVDAFEKTLKWNIFGFVLFFFLFSFKMGVEIHWTAAAFPPLAYISYQSLRNRDKAIRWFKPLAISGIFFIIFLRLLIANDQLANWLKINTSFNNWKEFSNNVEKISNDRGVVFNSSYKWPSEYSFYSRKPSVSIAMMGYRYSQFDFENYDEFFIRKNVVLVGTNNSADSAVKDENSKDVTYRNIPNFITYQHIEIYHDYNQIIGNAGDSLKLKVGLKNVSERRMVLDENQNFIPKFGYLINGKNFEISDFKLLKEITNRNIFSKNETIYTTINVGLPKDKGNYELRYAIIYGEKFRGRVSKGIKMVVK